MPKQVKRWQCAAKGCRYTKAKKETIHNHEKTCWKIPENKTCLSCKHEVIVKDSDEFQSWQWRECASPNEFSPSFDDIKPRQNEALSRPFVNCRFWEAKDGN